jgi:hypothetical protein
MRWPISTKGLRGQDDDNRPPSPPSQKPLAPQHCLAAQSAQTGLRPEAEPRPSEVLIPDPLGRKAGPKAQAAAGDSRKQYRVQVCPFLPGADETRQPRDGETRQGAMHDPLSVTAEKNVTRNGTTKVSVIGQRVRGRFIASSLMQGRDSRFPKDLSRRKGHRHVLRMERGERTGDDEWRR